MCSSMKERTRSRRSAIRSEMTAVAISSHDRRDARGAPTCTVRGARPRGRALRARSARGRRLEAGVKAPRPYGYIPDLSGREAFVMERLEGDTIGRRIVQKDELAAARAALPVQMAEELAKIHAILP